MEEISTQLAGIRAELVRRYQLEGLEDDRAALAEAVACVAKAEEAVHRLREVALNPG